MSIEYLILIFLQTPLFAYLSVLAGVHAADEAAQVSEPGWKNLHSGQAKKNNRPRGGGQLIEFAFFRPDILVYNAVCLPQPQRGGASRPRLLVAADVISRRPAGAAKQNGSGGTTAARHGAGSKLLHQGGEQQAGDQRGDQRAPEKCQVILHWMVLVPKIISLSSQTYNLIRYCKLPDLI